MRLQGVALVIRSSSLKVQYLTRVNFLSKIVNYCLILIIEISLYYFNFNILFHKIQYMCWLYTD